MTALSFLSKRSVAWKPLLTSWTAALQVALNPRALPHMLQELFGKNARESEHNVNEVLADNGILLAVPKKKVSHQKKRQKLYGPGRKQLQMIHHLNRCSSCGHFKRANTLCMHCVGEIRHIWKSHTAKEISEPQQELELSELDKRVLYPGKKETDYAKKLKEKDTYLERRMRTLPVNKAKYDVE
ncbi:LAME_0E10330g1_1 [Lachancea meyersii CBS 8951]|uniref:Large ribosomal subunit protein bL32m n=1 Tax=Lachancea meyersii CBS 8951 TaxID=1266667 RepID=A0A1G4JJY5_9SACH|nr:LAME_0E10330g1_1 [Lachancea meyersii CBS 8951]